MIESLYITDGSLVLEYLTSSEAPKYSALEPILESGDSPIEVNSEYFVVFDKVGSLTYHVLCSGKHELNPMIPPVFLERFRFALSEYFGQITANKIKTNTDTVVLILNEMLHGDIPYITDANQLKDLVPSKSLLSKILSTGSNLVNQSSKSMTIEDLKSTGDITWRRSNVKYTNNEIYVDIVESINVILKPVSTTPSFSSRFYSASKSTRAVPITGEIQGQVHIKSHLSGVPLLQLVMNKRDLDPKFHQCVDMDKWRVSPGTLNFIPPDGNCILIEYSMDITPDLLGVIDIDFQSGIGDEKNEFEIRVFVKDHPFVTKLDELKIDVVCDYAEEVREDEDDETRDSEDSGKITNVKMKRITLGDFRYVGKGKSEWTLDNIKPGSSPILHAVINTEGERDQTRQLKPLYISAHFSYKGEVPSGVRVDSLNIISAKGMGSTVKPYKGVKYITKSGSYIMRS